MPGNLFFRHTHEDGKERYSLGAQNGAEKERVWQSTKTIVGHMLDHEKGKTLEQLFKEVLAYRTEHPETHKWGPAPTRGDVAQDLLALIGADLAYQGHSKPKPSWDNRVLAYLVGYLDTNQDPPTMKHVAIYSEFPVTNIAGRGQVQVELWKEYQREPGEVYGDAEKRLRERIAENVYPYNTLAWARPYLDQRR